MADLSQATQILTSQDKVRRFAICPEHKKQSSDYRAVQESLIDIHVEYWAFHCRERGGHVFLALPDKTAPKQGGEQAWIEKQKMGRIAAMEKKRQ